jgi:hypothetical protein
VRVWELKSQLAGGVHFALTKSLGGMHAAPVTAAALLDGGGEGGATTWALTSDAHGRLMCHNLSRHLSVAASAISSFARGLTGGGGSGPSHLIPLQQAAGGSQFDPGLVCAIQPLHPPAAAPGSTGQQFAPDAASALFLPEAGHFLLVVCTRAALACALTPEGRLHMLHVFLPPHNTPADCSPYAAWRLASGGRAGAGGQPAPVVVTLAVAWQHSVSAYSATLLQRRAVAMQQGQQPPTPPAPLPPPALLRSWVVGPRSPPSGTGSSGSLSSAGAGDTGICGCCFLDSGPLVRGW